jgi:hypothetical protein
MKLRSKLILIVAIILFAPVFTLAQSDTAATKVVDTTARMMTDTTAKIVHDTIAPVVKPDTLVMTPPTNCYKQWYDVFRSRGAKHVPDGKQDVVIAFKSGESCQCFLGKVDVVGGKIKKPLSVKFENGEYKTFESLGKKLDNEFIANEGADLWSITDGMSVMFITADKEYGRLFFYKFINKGAEANVEAPSPDELLKN